MLRGLGSLVGAIRYRRYRPFVVLPKQQHAARTKEKTSAVAVVEKIEESAASIDSSIFLVGPLQSMQLVNSFACTDSSGTIKLSLTLDVDTRRQSVRGVCQLPNGLKSDSKLVVFCSDFDAAEMIELGADFAGMTELLARIGKGWTGFDRCLATPAVMPQVMKVAKVLGPKKLMPNPKSGTLVTDLKRAILESKSGAQLEYRTRETEPIVEVAIGSLGASMTANLDNIKFFVKEILKQQKTRQSSDDTSGGSEKLITIGGISLSPNMEKLNRILGRRKEAKKQGAVATGGFIKSAYVQLGDDGPIVGLDPGKLHPSSPAYYR